MEDYIKCELIGEGSPRHLNYTYINMLCIVAIVDCAHVGLATASFEDLVTLLRRTLQQIF